MKVNFETERLIIRPLVPDDAEAAFRWCGDPNVNTYMIYPLYHRAEDVRTWLESRDADDPDNYDEGICLKSTGELIGSGGMRYHPERNAWEIGYNLRADQWGHGYTGEYLTALLDVIRKARPVEAIGRHMHWHIFPRRNGDTPKPGPVWQVQDMNDDRYLPSGEKLEELKSSLRKELDLLCK